MFQVLVIDADAEVAEAGRSWEDARRAEVEVEVSCEVQWEVNALRKSSRMLKQCVRRCPGVVKVGIEIKEHDLTTFGR